MLPFLAQITLPSSDWWWQASLAAAGLVTTGSAGIVGLYYWRKMTSKPEKPEPREIAPQPLVVQGAVEYATTEDVQALSREFEARMQGMAESSALFRRDMRLEQKEIGERLTRVETKIEGQGDKLNHMDAKLDRLMERPA